LRKGKKLKKNSKRTKLHFADLSGTAPLKAEAKIFANLKPSDKHLTLYSFETRNKNNFAEKLPNNTRVFQTDHFETLSFHSTHTRTPEILTQSRQVGRQEQSRHPTSPRQSPEPELLRLQTVSENPPSSTPETFGSPTATRRTHTRTKCTIRAAQIYGFSEPNATRLLNKASPRTHHAPNKTQRNTTSRSTETKRHELTTAHLCFGRNLITHPAQPLQAHRSPTPRHRTESQGK